MKNSRVNFLLLNFGHFLDHYFMLVFASAAALTLSQDWNMSYAELIPYATPGFVAFAVFALPAGWIADKWSREGMMIIFFIGIGCASILAAFSSTPLELAGSLFLVGAFAAIYHPVGLSLVIQNRDKTGMALAINSVFGNLGVASAALITGFLIDQLSWKAAFYGPGFLSIILGLVFWKLTYQSAQTLQDKVKKQPATEQDYCPQKSWRKIMAIILFTTAIGGLVFQSTTFGLPKIFDEKLLFSDNTASDIGALVFIVFSLAAVAQLIVGYLIDRIVVRYIFMSIAAIQIISFALMPQLNGWSALFASMIFMLAVFGQIPINDVLIGRIARGTWRSRIFALRYLVSFSVTAIAIPFISWIYGSWGFDLLFVLLSFAASFVFLAVMLLPKRIGAEQIELEEQLSVKD